MWIKQWFPKRVKQISNKVNEEENSKANDVDVNKKALRKFQMTVATAKKIQTEKKIVITKKIHIEKIGKDEDCQRMKRN